MGRRAERPWPWPIGCPPCCPGSRPHRTRTYAPTEPFLIAGLERDLRRRLGDPPDPAALREAAQRSLLRAAGSARRGSPSWTSVTDCADAVVVGAGPCAAAAVLAAAVSSLVDRFEAGHTRQQPWRQSHLPLRLRRSGHGPAGHPGPPALGRAAGRRSEILLEEIGALDHGNSAASTLHRRHGRRRRALRTVAARCRGRALAPPAIRGNGRPPAHGRAVPGRRHGRGAARGPRSTGRRAVRVGPATVSLDGDRPRAGRRGRVDAAAVVVTAGGWMASLVGPGSSVALPLRHPCDRGAARALPAGGRGGRVGAVGQRHPPHRPLLVRPPVARRRPQGRRPPLRVTSSTLTAGATPTRTTSTASCATWRVIPGAARAHGRHDLPVHDDAR